MPLVCEVPSEWRHNLFLALTSGYPGEYVCKLRIGSDNITEVGCMGREGERHAGSIARGRGYLPDGARSPAKLPVKLRLIRGCKGVLTPSSMQRLPGLLRIGILVTNLPDAEHPITSSQHEDDMIHQL